MNWNQEERKARAEVALYSLRQRLACYKKLANENAATQARQLQSHPAAHPDYLAQWPDDWRGVCRKAAARRYSFGERDATPMPADGLRYVENFESAFRSWAYVADITRGHYFRAVDSDWYCDSDHNRLGRAIVARLSHGRFIPGIRFEEHKHKDTGALFDFRDITDDEEKDSAIAAARLCERVAEKERDYNEAWNAGAEFIGLREETQLTRGELLESLAEMRAARKALKQAGVEQLPSVCAAMRSHVRAGLRGIAKARKRQSELREQYGTTPGFNDGIAC